MFRNTTIKDEKTQLDVMSRQMILTFIIIELAAEHRLLLIEDDCRSRDRFHLIDHEYDIFVFFLFLLSFDRLIRTNSLPCTES